MSLSVQSAAPSPMLKSGGAKFLAVIKGRPGRLILTRYSQGVLRRLGICVPRLQDQ